MAFNKRSIIRQTTVPVEPGREFCRYTYATDDAKEQLQTANYFGDYGDVLQVNDIIDAVADHKGKGDIIALKVTAADGIGKVTVSPVGAAAQ